MSQFTYLTYMLMLLSVLGPTVDTLLLEIDAFYKNANIIDGKILLHCLCAVDSS